MNYFCHRLEYASEFISDIFSINRANIGEQMGELNYRPYSSLTELYAHWQQQIYCVHV